MVLLRLVVLFLGAFLFMNSVARMAWECWQWYVLARLEQRPTLIDGRPVGVNLVTHVWVASAGLAVLLCAMR